MSAPVADADPLRATEAWFLRNGLPYFVPSERAAARAALHPRRTLPLVVLVGLLAAGAGWALAWVSDDLAFAPATLVSIGAVAAAFYGLTALRARPLLGWALARTMSSLRMLLPMVTRALPLLLLFVTFLFINAEVWEVAASWNGGVLWLTVLLFALMGAGFLLGRLPEEVDRTDDSVDDKLLLAACAGTPLEDAARELVADPDSDPAAYATITGFERWNLILVLMIVQAVQVLLLVLSVFVFLMLFGSLAMTDEVVLGWAQQKAGDVAQLPGLPNTSLPLLKVATFLSAFSGLYFTVSALTDETYRGQFFSGVLREMERAVGVRAVYRALRARSGQSL
ncbi:hypothetical protein [Nocardioides pacificus]